MKMKTLVAVTVIAVLAAGCASKPEKIPTAYVSPLTYKDYDCDQLIMEMDHVSHRTTELHTSLKKKADNDAAAMGVGMILFWPALFALDGGDGPEATEYSRLKGTYEALRQNVVSKKCATASMPPSPEELIEREKAKAKAKAKEDGEV